MLEVTRSEKTTEINSGNSGWSFLVFSIFPKIHYPELPELNLDG